MKKFIITTLLLLGFIVQPAVAMELGPVQPPPEIPYVQRLADDLDDFLSGNDEIVTGPNDTQLTIGQRLIWNEGGEWDYRPYADVRLHLPKFAEKWRLRFTTYDTDEEEVGVNRLRVKRQQREEDVGLAIFFLSQFENVQMTFRPRVDGDGVSHVLRFRRPSDFWALKFGPKLELFARPEEGTGAFLALDMAYEINSAWLFTLVNEAQYTDLDNTFATNQGLAFRQIIKKNMNQYYSLIYESSNQPHFRLDQYILSTNFEHYFNDRSMVYRLIPSMVYERQNDFHGNPQMTFELDFIF